MFKGISYRLNGFNNLWIAFDDRDARGVATVMYSKALDATEQATMARRIVAAMNLTQNMSLAELERAEPMPATDPISVPLTAAQRRDARAALGALVHAGPQGQDEAIDKIAAMAYANGARDAPPLDRRLIGWLCPEDPDAVTAFKWAHGALPAKLPLCTDCGREKIPVWARLDP